jgi:chorismate synthase
MQGNTFGRVFRVTAAGESYGPSLLAVVDGVPPGIHITEAEVQADLDRRRPGQSAITSPRKETDVVKIVTGVFDDFTTGAPVSMIIYNVDTKPYHVHQYAKVMERVRPGHADYTFHVKYGRFRDWRGAGRSSGRETACRVAAGVIAKKILKMQGIEIRAYVKEMAGIKASENITWDDIVNNTETNIARCPDLDAAAQMIETTLDAARKGDTVGGIIEVIAKNVPAGLGEPVFDKLIATLAHGIMSIGAVRGVEFGDGFAEARSLGSINNDIPYYDENGEVKFRSNHAGGMLGGISNGDDIVFRLAVKPASTISIDQDTVNVMKKHNDKLSAETRRDPSIVPRVVPVAEAMTALVLVDQLMMWNGYKSLSADIEHGEQLGSYIADPIYAKKKDWDE